MIPYGRQTISEEDIEAVVQVLRSDWLTTGPVVESFERELAKYVNSKFAVAVSNGTAALHAAMYALQIGPGDEVIVPAMTFAATANCVVFQGAIPVFADVDSNTLLIDLNDVKAKITPRTKAIIAVDYAGQPCDYDKLREIATRYGLALVADACHSLGASYKGKPVGSLADLNIFSLHPVKAITTGEGGVITTNDSVLAQKMRIFRNHGISSDHRQREQQGLWFYEMIDLGYNYRLTDFQCALGVSQLKKLSSWILHRQEIAKYYNGAFEKIEGIEPLHVSPKVSHAYHLYVIRIDENKTKKNRESIFKDLRVAGIGVNVHYIPVYLHPFYQRKFKTRHGQCPMAEAAYKRILSLPVYPGLTEQQQHEVVTALNLTTTRNLPRSSLERTK